MKKSISIPAVSFVLAVFFLLNSAPVLAQKAHPVDVAIEEYATQFSPERAYLHYDKSAYFPGETIWFKAYLFNEVVPAMESKTFYTDWYDDKGNLLYHTVSPLVDAVTNGQFEIPADYKGSYIHVRAYTRWMLNFDSAFLYTKQLRVLGNDAPGGAKQPRRYTLKFFPEGGELVAGLNNKVAFKANDQWGQPVKVRGYLTNAQGRKMDSIRSQHDGMGYFFLVPEKGQSYSVKWRDEKNVEYTAALPAAKDQGFTLQVAISTDSRRFLVNYSPETAAQMDTVHLVGTMHQHEVFRIARATSQPEIKGLIPTTALPTGILTVTLFDKTWKPIAERITFINNEEYAFKPTMEVQRWGLNKRARNEIKITLPDSLAGNFSVSVTDAAIGVDSSTNIISHILLSSELKGDIYKPAYYFSAPYNEVAFDLDLVMLTHGWRRFKWEELLAGKTPKPVYHRDSTYISLSGKVLGVTQVNPGASVVLLVTQNKKLGQTLVVPIQPNGHFDESGMVLFDTAQVFYQFQDKDLKRSASIQFLADRLQVPSVRKTIGDRVFGVGPDTAGSYQQWRLAKEAAEWAEKFRVKTLENVIIKSKTKTPLQVMDEKYTSGLFVGGDGYQFDLVNDPVAAGQLNIFTYLQGKVAGLQITTSGSNVSMSWRGATPALFLNEMPADIDLLTNISVQDVAYVKVLRPPFMGASGGGTGGAIAVYTRRGDDVKATPGKGLSNNRVEGYTAIREFFSPNYSSFSPDQEQRDLRTTLYWNPQVSASAQKPAVLTFYNNDVTKAFRVIIEGITKDGRMAHIEEIME